MRTRKIAALPILVSLLSAGGAFAAEGHGSRQADPQCDGTKKPEDVKKPPSIMGQMGQTGRVGT